MTLFILFSCVRLQRIFFYKDLILDYLIIFVRTLVELRSYSRAYCSSFFGSYRFYYVRAYLIWTNEHEFHFVSCAQGEIK